MKMLKVDGGTFLMGSDLGDASDRPAHQVAVESFSLAACPVTQAEWKALLGHNPSSVQGGSLPVDRVSWLDALAFCNALSAKEGLPPCYSNQNGRVLCDFSAAGYRLPREAEWEYAARGGLLSRACLFPGSNNVSEVAWYSGNSRQGMHPVGKLKANELGLYDMSGNVYEWCWDLYGPYDSPRAYPSDPPEDPRDDADKELTMEVLPLATEEKPEPSIRRVMRGGNCLGNSYRLRCSSRWSGLPDRGYDYSGLRVARSV